MSWRGLLVAVTAAVVAASCSDSTQESPATAPPTTVATTTATTMTVATTAPTLTATVPPTPEEARLVEIEAIFRDLEYRRLDALYRDDEEAYRAVFSSAGYLTQGLDLEFGSMSFLAPPSDESIRVEVLEVLVDAQDCIAAIVDLDFTSALGPDAMGTVTKVVAPTSAGRLGIAYAGDDWQCVGPHPLDG